jgi:hypothetical protein
VHELEGQLTQTDHILEYRTSGLDILKEARKELERENTDMTREFGELHIIQLGLCEAIRDLLDGLGPASSWVSLPKACRIWCAVAWCAL